MPYEANLKMALNDITDMSYAFMMYVVRKVLYLIEFEMFKVKDFSIQCFIGRFSTILTF